MGLTLYKVKYEEMDLIEPDFINFLLDNFIYDKEVFCITAEDLEDLLKDEEREDEIEEFRKDILRLLRIINKEEDKEINLTIA